MNLSDISRKTRGRTIFWLVAIILALFLWNHFKENKTYRWSEILKTSDGNTLRIKRKVEFVGGRDEITVSIGRRADKQVVVFKSIDGTDIDITWESTRRGFRNANPEVPLIVDYDSKENMPIVFSINGLEKKLHCYEYFKYKYINRKWISNKVTNIDVGREANLYLGIPTGIRFFPINEHDREKKLKDSKTARSTKLILTDQVYCRYERRDAK